MKRNTRVFPILAVFLALSFAPSAHAMKKSTIVLRATGSGAVLGAAAGLVSYPFAKSTSAIIAGAFVGAVLGTVYGFHLADMREQAYRSQAHSDARPMPRDPTLASREWNSRRGFFRESGDPAIALPFRF